MKFILGKKVGMTQILSESAATPVTLVEAGPCLVTHIKTKEHDGYDAVQIGFVESKKISKPQAGQSKKTGKSLKYLREFRVDNPAPYKVGQVIDVSLFNSGDKVKVAGTSKGRGFSGVIKRHGFHRGPMGHGSDHHREPGSIGCRFPQRVIKGRKLPGQYGASRITIKNLEIIETDKEHNILALKGAIVGAPGGLLEIKQQVTNNKQLTTNNKQETMNNRQETQNHTEEKENTNVSDKN